MLFKQWFQIAQQAEIFLKLVRYFTTKRSQRMKHLPYQAVSVYSFTQGSCQTGSSIHKRLKCSGRLFTINNSVLNNVLGIIIPCAIILAQTSQPYHFFNILIHGHPYIGTYLTIILVLNVSVEYTPIY